MIPASSINRLEAKPRPFYRLHASTYVVLLLTLAALFLLNVPSQRRTELSLYPYERQQEVVLQKQTPLVLVARYKPQINASHCLSHGWPCTWLVREDREHPDLQTGQSRDTRIWSFSEDLRQFYAGRLAVNVAIAAAIAAAVGLLFERWRRRRKRLWQQTISDWLVLIAVVGGATAFALKTARDYRQDRDGLRSLGYLDVFDRDSDSVGLFERLAVITRTPGGPTWLQELLGERRIPWLDRTVQLGVFANRLEHLPKFPQLSALTIHGLRLTDERLSHLSQLKRLELLYLERAPTQMLAPGLAGDTDPDSPNDLQAVEQLLGYLAELNHLQQLRLTTRAFGDDAAHVISAFPKLRILIVDDARALTDDGLAVLGNCNNLEVLDLGVGNRITSDGLRQLATLPHLSILELNGRVRFGDPVIDALRTLASLEEFSADCSGMTARGIERFAELPNLRRLKLINVPDDSAVARLRQKRPDMHIRCEFSVRFLTPNPLPLPADERRLPIPALSYSSP